MTRRGLALVICAWLVVALVALRAPVGVRAPAVIAFALFVPGAAVLAFAARTEPVTRLVALVATSLSIDVVASESLALAHLFSGLNCLCAIAAVTSLVVLAHRFAKAPRSKRPIETKGGRL